MSNVQTRHSFIHSFIHFENLYTVAPLQAAYSEALPAQPRLNRDDLSSWEKAPILLRGSKRSSSGSPFWVEGPTIEKARCCLRDERARGTRSSPLAEERRARRDMKWLWHRQVSEIWLTVSAMSCVLSAYMFMMF
jgi:hypothetical protein